MQRHHVRFMRRSHQKITRQGEISLAFPSAFTSSHSCKYHWRRLIPYKVYKLIEGRLKPIPKGMEESLKKLTRAFKKSSTPSFRSYKAAIGTNSLSTSAINEPSQSHPLYGMTKFRVRSWRY
jgi:hypothetical protein